MGTKFNQVGSLCIFGVKDFLWTNEWTRFFEEFNPSGLALFNSPFDSPSNIWKDKDAALEVVYEFIRKAEEKSVPFVCVDQEGGRVRRLRGHFIALPSAQKMTEAHRDRKISMPDIGKLYQLAARQMKSSGIALDFAPVCDLRLERSSNVVGDRSFGSNKAEAIEYIRTCVEAFESEGVHSTLKHFPGHGPTEFDSHEKIAVIFKEKRELMAEDLKVFEEIAPFASAIMTAHIAFAENPERIVSLDKELLEELGRNIPKDKYWITDDMLSMKAVSEDRSWRAALECRYDFLLMCGDFGPSLSAMEDLIRFAESEYRSFTKESDLLKRIERSRRAFSRKQAIPPYSQWRKIVLECELEAASILEKIG